MDLAGCSEANAGGAVVTLKCIPFIIANLINYAFIFAGVVALIFVILAGYRLITASGDPKKAEDARKTLTFAIIGLVIILLAFGIINIIIKVTNIPIFNFKFG